MYIYRSHCMRSASVSTSEPGEPVKIDQVAPCFKAFRSPFLTIRLGALRWGLFITWPAMRSRWEDDHQGCAGVAVATWHHEGIFMIWTLNETIRKQFGIHIGHQVAHRIRSFQYMVKEGPPAFHILSFFHLCCVPAWMLSTQLIIAGSHNWQRETEWVFHYTWLEWKSHMHSAILVPVPSRFDFT